VEEKSFLGVKLGGNHAAVMGPGGGENSKTMGGGTRGPRDETPKPKEEKGRVSPGNLRGYLGCRGEGFMHLVQGERPPGFEKGWGKKSTGIRLPIPAMAK